MDVIFELESGREFSIEVGYFDTVLEIKEKVQKYVGIPISRQTLIFKDKVLPDDGDIWKCEIFEKSRIRVVVPVMIETEELSSSTKIRLMVKLALSKTYVPIEMDVNDIVLKLKERIHDIEHVSINNLRLHSAAAGTELHDHQFLRNCGVSDYSEIHVSVRPSSVTTAVPTTTVAAAATTRVGGGGSKDNIWTEIHVKVRPSSVTTMPVTGVAAAKTSVGGGGSKNNSEVHVSVRPSSVPETIVDTGVGGGGGGSKKLKLNVLLKNGTDKIPIEVNASDNVRELRNELHKLQQSLQFHLPKEGYFFIYNQNVMYDDMSFRWHCVKEDDTIEIFGGTVTST